MNGRLHPDDIDAIARRVAELINVGRPRWGDAQALASEIGRSRAFVYAHAAELGAVRVGDGERPRLQFDLARARAAYEASFHRQVNPRRAARRIARAGSRTPAPLLPVREEPVYGRSVDAR